MGNLTVKESGEMVNFISPNVSNITSFKVHFSPKQEGEGDPSPENVREIVGWNGVEGYKCGKNLFDYIHANILDRHIKNDNGVSISDGGNSYCQTYIPVMPNTTYTLSGLSNEKRYAKRVYYYDESKQWISRTSSTVNRTFTITTPSNCRYIQIQSERQEFQDWSTVQVELGDTATEFEPYKYGTVFMDWTDTIGNIYGGYVDLITGELVQTYEQIIFNGTIRWTSITNYDNYNRFVYYKESLPLPPQNNAICYFNYLTNGSGQIGKGFIGSTGNVLIYTDKNINSIDSLMEYQTNNPLQLIYELETSVLVATLSPTQLSTLKGQNNFWSNADYIEIEYELTETFDIQKAKRKIILNQPHVESASGDIVTFDTDMKGKLKECRVYFSPVQEGEGDPSPDNVRTITGWSEVKLYCCGKNLFQHENGAKSILNLKKGTTITISQSAESDLGYFRGYDINNNTVTSIIWINEGIENNRRYKNYTLIDDIYYGVIYVGTGIQEAQVTIDGTIDYEPYQSNIINIDWTDDVGTVYRGYVDLVSGELVQTHYLAEITTTGLTSQNINYDTTEDSIHFIIKNSFPQMLSNNSNGKDRTYSSEVGILPVDCKVNYLKPDYIDNWQGTTNVNTIVRAYVPPNFSVRMARDLIGVTSEDSETIKAQKINNYLTEHPLQVYYKLETPIHYQLTPQQLTTRRGTNNIYSNTNGQTEIKYWTH